MSERRHTPGSWFLEEGWSVVHSDAVTRIADCRHSKRYGAHSERLDKAEQEANARLIAAAPDMLEALEQAYAFIADEYGDAESQALDGEHVSREARPVWHSICNALAKAKEAPDHG